MNAFGFEILCAAFSTYTFTCVGCRVMSLIIVKLKLQMFEFRKGVLVFKIEYHVSILIFKQPDYIHILYIFRYRKPQSFGDNVSNYSSHHLMHWSFFRGDPYYYIQK